MITVFLAIAKYFWIFAISLILLILYIGWYYEVVKDFKITKKGYGKKLINILENLELGSKVFIALHIALPIIASLTYFLLTLNAF